MAFKQLNPYQMAQRGRKEMFAEIPTNEPQVRINSSLCYFNLAARDKYNLDQVEGLELYLDEDKKALGIKFKDSKDQQSYKLTSHKTNGVKMFSILGVLSRFKIKAPKGGKFALIKDAPKNLQRFVDVVIDLSALEKAA